MAKSNKGAKWEREICKSLSRWWSIHYMGQNRDDIFWRTAGSGGRATSRRKGLQRTAEQYGDLKADHKEGKPFTDFFLVEMKRGYNDAINLCTLIDCPLDMKMPIVVSWYLKAESERIYARRKAVLLLFKRDRRDAVVMIDMRTLHSLENQVDMRLGEIAWASFRTRFMDQQLVFFRLHDFLNRVFPQDIVKLLEITPTPRIRA